MKSALNLFLFLFLFSLILFGDKSYSLSNYKIKQICKREKKESICIKNLQEKRFNLNKGNLIEIPVIPYKGNFDLNFKF